MSLLQRLLRNLNRAFSKDPVPFLGLRLRYDGAMQWAVSGRVLVTAVQGGSGGPLVVDLTQHTVRSLAGFLSLQPGYDVPWFATDPEEMNAAAVRLVDGSGDIDAGLNGDHLYAYTSVLYAWLDTAAVELEAVGAAIRAMPDEMATTTADGLWLDYLGSFYAVPRQVGETDVLYGRRIIATVVRAKCNNVAMEAAISAYTGQTVTVSDVATYGNAVPKFDGAAMFNGAYHFQPVSKVQYGLFDVQAGYDLLNGGVPADFVAAVRALVEQLRAAGTHLRAVGLGGSALSDDVSAPTEGGDSLTTVQPVRFDGTWRFDGTVMFGGNRARTGPMATVSGTG